MSATLPLPEWLATALCCPGCRGDLLMGDTTLVCRRCHVKYPVEAQLVRLLAPELRTSEQTFYAAPDPARYGRATMPEAFLAEVGRFLAPVPHDGVVLEIGSGQGALDSVHPGYVALDFSAFALQEYSSGARVQADAGQLPFRNASVDAVLTRATLEHVPDPEGALSEIDRCLKPGGRAFVYPSWYVRPWAAKGLHVRPYGELSVSDRLRKLTIPVRDARPWWLAKVLPGRVRRELALARGAHGLRFDRRRLEPNHETYLVSDSDAYSSMDPHAAAAFFLSRGYADLGRPTAARRLAYGHEPVVVVKAT